MAHYLVVHSPEPDKESENDIRPPSRLEDLARVMSSGNPNPKWLRAWSAEIGDDRIFTLWEADDAAAITRVLAEYGFLDDLSAKPLRVRAWGPAEVLAASTADESS